MKNSLALSNRSYAILNGFILNKGSLVFMRLIIISLILSFFSCAQQTDKTVRPGAYQMDDYLSLLENKNVGVTVNHTSIIEDTHLTDTLLSRGIKLKKVFTPEHGFSGRISDGVEIEYEEEKETFELISLYGKNKKPEPQQLEGLDIMVFDIQDVGARFYTYISTMHYVMEACAENNIPVIILDRPNPNGSYIDGPVLDTAYSSFVGMHPIPIVYGLTIGELARMINGEGWLKNGIKCDLSVIEIDNWNHQTSYSLPVKPSPNLPNDLSITLYPSLCLFEGTTVSVGRGTKSPFLQIGHPTYSDTTHSFTPVSMEGAKWPPYEQVTCYGKSFANTEAKYEFTLLHLIKMYNSLDDEDFFKPYFKRLVGNDTLSKQIQSGMSEKEIKASWEDDLVAYKSKRQQYLIYD